MLVIYPVNFLKFISQGEMSLWPKSLSNNKRMGPELIHTRKEVKSVQSHADLMHPKTISETALMHTYPEFIFSSHVVPYKLFCNMNSINLLLY